MTDVVLVVNTGSSSIKVATYALVDPEEPLWKGEIDGIGRTPTYESRSGKAPGPQQAVPSEFARGHRSLIHWLLERLRQEQPTLKVAAAGHRVVHGGRRFSAPALVTETVLEELHGLSALAPSHQPHNLAGIQAVADTWPEIPQVACFDTAFHRSQPRVAQLFALPRWLSDEGVLRYGFHGLSYEYIASVLPDYLGTRAEGRIVVAHLGHGASLCALRDRHSIATSMGFTALDGLVMGKRCGALDPGVVLHLLRDRGMSMQQVDALLSHESGLLGVSGISDDMRDLLESDDPHAREAIELFVYRALSQLGALVAQLGGLDGLVFTAGIGEHSPEIRRRLVAGLAWLGASLDPAANAAGASCISSPTSALPVHVIATDEEGVIARHTCRLTQAMTLS
ncbi:acetate kinase [Modicisalibacter ilicicola DSM 19980]|uniref:Acetate kinase n=1 Tax=Modicisalibacter ilicicola DSM 19980 TaxID=1121942 RepID=A0A1M4UWZ2_9GAMM|nr:acetate/propionate family kinase [Halomonas ilicicola]SHE61202.1 acetate kinase [Halomonas ilicicola DSM 19980]